MVRAARYGLPLTLAIIGGSPTRFRRTWICIYQALETFGNPLQPIAVHSPGHVAATDDQAKNELWPHYEAMMNRIGGERGWPPATRAQFEHEAGPRWRAVRRIAGDGRGEDHRRRSSALGLSRFDLKYSSGTLAHDKMMRSIELIGTEVAPRVREAVAGAVDEREDREQQQDRRRRSSCAGCDRGAEPACGLALQARAWNWTANSALSC